MRSCARACVCARVCVCVCVCMCNPTHSQAGEGDADDEVADPVEEPGDGHGGRARTLLEQLASDELRDGACGGKRIALRLKALQLCGRTLVPDRKDSGPCNAQDPSHQKS